jgi:beta-phosphoglucomutase-like phosphatase (HAD superfamily)
VTAPAAILDVDGTLVDTNYQHALAWYRAFRDQGVTLPLHRIHRHIGMGGDQLVAALAGDDFERAHGDAAREAEGRRYEAMIGEVAPLPHARDLIVRLRERGHDIVLASSAKPHEVEHYPTSWTPASSCGLGPRRATWSAPSRRRTSSRWRASTCAAGRP